MLSIFGILLSLFEQGWKLIGWVGEVIWKLAMGSLHIGLKCITGVVDLVLGSCTWGLDRVLDLSVWSRGDLMGILWWVLTVLLAACLVFALMAFASNTYRRFRGRWQGK